MTNEEIVIEASKICQEITKNNYGVNLSQSFHIKMITIIIFDEKGKVIFTLYTYLNKDYSEINNYVNIKNFIPTIKNYIKKELKLTV